MSDNPFRLETVIRVMAEEAEVDTLKEMRKVTAKWNYFSVKELGNKASKLQLDPIVFHGDDHKFLESFLEETKSNPQLFQSFKFFYPGTLSLEFFKTDYTPKFIRLIFDGNFKFRVDDQKYLHDFFQMIAPKLEEFEIQVFKLSGNSSTNDEAAAPLSLPTMSGEQLMFPKLSKFSLKNHWNCVADTSKLISFFKFILDKSVAVDPSPRLIILEIDSIISNLYNAIGLDPLTPTALDRWTRLTHLSIDATEVSDVKLTSTLAALGEAGMSLQHLNILIYRSCILERPHLSLIANNYSNFFHTQAKSLKSLKFRCNFEQMGDATEEDLIQAQIRLPVFVNLQTFKLKIISIFADMPHRIFKLGSFPLHFPKLDTLHTFNHQVLSIMFPEDTIPEPIPLRFLKIRVWTQDREDWEGWKDGFGDKFSSVETLKCQAMILDDGEKKIPWVESLRMLEIYEVKSLLRLRYLKNLRELAVIEDCLPRPKKYLRYFHQVRGLHLSAITFKFQSGELSKKDKARIMKFFPFTVNFIKI